MFHCSVVPASSCSLSVPKDSGIEIPVAWIPTIKIQENGTTADHLGNSYSSEQRNNEVRNAPITADLCDIKDTVQCLKKTSSKQSKRRDLHLNDYIMRQTITHYHDE